MSLIKRLAGTLAAGFFFVAPMMACEEPVTDDVEDEEGNSNSPWEDINECDIYMREYINSAICFSERYSEEIVEEIDKEFPEEYQTIQPENVLALLAERNIPINCGVLRPEENPDILATWSNTDEYITLNEVSWEEIRLDYYANGSYFLKDECYLDEDKAREYMMQQDDLFGGFQDVYYAIRDLTVTGMGYGLSNVMVHETAHGAWYYEGLDNHHEDPIDFDTDPFYQYGWGCYVLDPIFFSEIGKDIVDIRLELEDEGY